MKEENNNDIEKLAGKITAGRTTPAPTNDLKPKITITISPKGKK